MPLTFLSSKQRELQVPTQHTPYKYEVTAENGHRVFTIGCTSASEVQVSEAGIRRFLEPRVPGWVEEKPTD